MSWDASNKELAIMVRTTDPARDLLIREVVEEAYGYRAHSVHPLDGVPGILSHEVGEVGRTPERRQPKLDGDVALSVDLGRGEPQLDQ